MVEEINNISYYNEETAQPENTKLNIVKPKDVENPPVLIWVGQGAWAYVNRDQEMGVCRNIAKNGICVISAGHSLSPAMLHEPHRLEGIQHPEHIKDVAHAVKWVYDHAEQYGYNKEQIFLGGYSSGAHLSALLATDKRYLTNVGLSLDIIKGIIPVGGCYDIPYYRDYLVNEDSSYLKNHIIPVFGESEDEHKDASPSEYLEHLDTPVLLISEQASYVHHKHFEDLLFDMGYQNVKSFHAMDETHAGMWINLGSEPSYIYRDIIVDFIKSNSSQKELYTIEDASSMSTAEKLAQEQLDAYNSRDIDAFLIPYADSVEVYTFPDQLQYTGKDKMRQVYTSMFDKATDLHCTLVNRVVQGNTVIDHEEVLFQEGYPAMKAIAIYEIENNKIAKVYFVQ